MAKLVVGMITLSFPRDRPRRGLGRGGRPLLVAPVPTSRARAGPLGGLRLGMEKEMEERAGTLAFPRALLLAIMIVATALALLYLWQGWRLTALESELFSQRAAVARLEALNEALRLKVEKAFSLERIALYAKTVLGMVEPPLRYLRLPAEEGGR